ncbi:MAG: delta-class carbonic anhydrase [Geminicoccales bacterium]
MELNTVEVVPGVHQAVNVPTDAGIPVGYTGSTTRPSYNEAGSPFQVSWSVRPNVTKVSIASAAKWLEDNAFDEDDVHGVCNLVTYPDLLSTIGN